MGKKKKGDVDESRAPKSGKKKKECGRMHWPLFSSR